MHNPPNKHQFSAAWGRALLLAVLLAQAVFGQSRIAKDFPAAEPGKNFDAIVQFYETPTGKHHKKVLDRGGRLKQELGVVKAGAYSLPAEALEALAGDPDVAYISPDRPGRATSFEYAAPSVYADMDWMSGWSGLGIGVAVIDSGADSLHPDL